MYVLSRQVYFIAIELFEQLNVMVDTIINLLSFLNSFQIDLTTDCILFVSNSQPQLNLNLSLAPPPAKQKDPSPRSENSELT